MASAAVRAVAGRARSRDGQHGVPAALQQHFSERHRLDFGKLRITQDDRAARALHAEAFTVGNQITFASGAYAPETGRGQWLLAHELSHAVQNQGPEASRLPVVQRFGHPGHRNALVWGMGDSLNQDSVDLTGIGQEDRWTASEVGEISRFNLERDFSQGSFMHLDMVVAWKLMRKAVLHRRSIADKASPEYAQATKNMLAARAVFKAKALQIMDAYPWTVIKQSLGGVGPTDHLDNPRTVRKDNVINGMASHLYQGRAYIKDQIIIAIHRYRHALGLSPIADVDNWNGLARPKGYGEVQDLPNPTMSRDIIEEEVTDMARAAGSPARRAAANSAEARAASGAAPHLGRASHALEDFFAHSNWELLAQELRTGQRSKTIRHLTTGGFPVINDALHSVSLKIAEILGPLENEIDILQEAFGLQGGGPRLPSSAWYSIESPGWTPLGSALRVMELGTQISNAQRAYDKKGKIDPVLPAAPFESFFGDPRFVAALRGFSNTMRDTGIAQSTAGNHANLALDDKPRHLRVHFAALADRMILAPLKRIGKTPDPKAARQALLEIFALIDKIIAPPTRMHPIYAFFYGE